jgi:hypothetical protein
MSTKLIIKLPLLPPFVEVKKEIDFPLSLISDFFSHKAKLPDPAAWTALTQLAVQFVLDDMHTKGRIQGGWGKSYAHRYLNLTYPNGVPDDASRQPDSPSGTAMVIQGFFDLLETEQLLDGKSKEAILTCLNASAKYLEDRYNPKTGELGLLSVLSSGDSSIAYNIRHTAMSIRAWRRLPGQYNRLVGSCTNIIDSANERTLENERSITVAAILSALLWIKSNDALERGIPNTHRIPFLCKKAETALIKQWSHGYGGWIDPQNPEASVNWYTAFVIRECEMNSGDLGDDLRQQIKMARNGLFDKIVIADNGGTGLPYANGKVPDLGMSCMLFEMLTRSGIHKIEKQHYQNICKFILAVGSARDNARFTKDTYPWTLVSLFSALQLLASNN